MLLGRLRSSPRRLELFQGDLDLVEPLRRNFDFLRGHFEVLRKDIDLLRLHCDRSHEGLQRFCGDAEPCRGESQLFLSNDLTLLRGDRGDLERGDLSSRGGDVERLGRKRHTSRVVTGFARRSGWWERAITLKELRKGRDRPSLVHYRYFHFPFRENTLIIN